jgi:hypothetical protein
MLGTLAHRFAPAQRPKPSPDRTAPVSCGVLCPHTPAHNTHQRVRPLAGGPGPIGTGLGRLSRQRELRLYGVLGSSRPALCVALVLVEEGVRGLLWFALLEAHCGL